MINSSFFYYKIESKKSSIDQVFEYINQQEGETLREKFNSFFINKINVSQDDIDLFCSEMLEYLDPSIVPIIEKGDANNDEEVDVKDIVDIVNHTMGKQTSTGKFDENEADINEDGMINIADIIKIVKIIRQMR